MIIPESLAGLVLMVEAYIVIFSFQLPYYHILASVLFEDHWRSISFPSGFRKCTVSPFLSGKFLMLPGASWSTPTQWTFYLAGRTLDELTKIWTMNAIVCKAGHLWSCPNCFFKLVNHCKFSQITWSQICKSDHKTFLWTCWQQSTHFLQFFLDRCERYVRRKIIQINWNLQTFAIM